MLDLNPEQKRAVEYDGGPLLIVAGPGSGKTRVLTERIVYLLARAPDRENKKAVVRTSAFEVRGPDAQKNGKRVTAENILALTFTEKAAQEMQRRVAQALPHLAALPTVSTFHAFSYHLLRQRRFDRRLLDKIDVWIFLRQRLKDLQLEFYQKLAQPGAFLHDLNEFFARCQDALIGPEEFRNYAEKFRSDFLRQHARLSAISHRSRPDPLLGIALSAEEKLDWEEVLKKLELARVFENSRKLLERAGTSSLGSLISEAVELLRSEPEFLTSVRERFRSILVDEFQDTNFAQVEFLKLLAGPLARITVVGDDDQAIYRFRGASYGAFEMFRAAFPEHETICLSRNYRSGRRILRAAAAVIRHNDRYRAKPALATERGEGPPVYLLSSPNAASEAAWVAEEVARLAREGTALGDVAVLYRAHAYRDPLVEEFRRRKIPFAIRGLSILSLPLARDLLAYLRVVDSRRENISMTRVLADGRWRIPESLAQEVRRLAAQNHCSLDEALGRSGSTPSLSALGDTAWNELDRMLNDLRQFSRSARVTALFDRLAELLGLAYLPHDPEQAYLEALRCFLEEWQNKSETGKLREFVEYFQYFEEAGGRIEAPEPEAGATAVQMMTVHAAKGLEFPIVFVISVAPRRFPHSERKPVIEFPVELEKAPRPPGDIHLQEERRLFYVATTRAKERLYISSVGKEGRRRSRLIDDLLSDPAVAAADIANIEVANAEEQNGVARAVVASDLQPQEPRSTEALNHSGWSRGGGQRSLFGGEPARTAPGPSPPSHWALQPVPPDSSDELTLSATSAEQYLACPLKYKFARVLRVPTGPQAALTFGNLMHAAVRHYFELRRESLPPFSAIETFFLEGWKSAGFDDEYQEQAYRRAGLDQLREFVDRQNACEVDANAVRLEESFRLDFGEWHLEGRIDQIGPLRLAGKEGVELVDYKTGRPRTQKDADQSLQLSVYALAAREQCPRAPVRLTFYNLTDNQPVSTLRTGKDLEKVVVTLGEVVAGIRRGEFPARPGFACRWCDFFPLCPAHERTL